LVLIGALANGINSVAGGGSLISFPYLMLVGRLPSGVANATNSVSLWPGSLSGLFGYRELIPNVSHYMKMLAIPTLIGAVAGSYLFVKTSAKVVDIVVPFLLLVAAFLLLFQPAVKAYVLRGKHTLHPTIGIILQVLVAIYGGYFGAGMGIMMLAAFGLYMEGTIHELNAVKTFLGTFINLSASVVFVVQGMVRYDMALPLIIGSIFGGFLAAKWGQRVNPEIMRKSIAYFGLAMAAYYFSRIQL
jgi:uncharacterized membrane protein YfcA